MAKCFILDLNEIQHMLFLMSVYNQNIICFITKYG